MVRKALVLKEEELGRFFELLKRWGDEVIAPKRGPEGELTLGRAEGIEEIEFVCESPLRSVKAILFPQVDSLFRWRVEEGRPFLEPVYDRKRRVLFSIHSCDVKGIEFLDRVMERDFPDPYYFERRKNTLLVSVTCQEPGDFCFCICTNCGPFLGEGFDLQLTSLQGRILVEVGSDKGEEALLLQGMEGLLSEATDRDIAERNEMEERARDKFKETRAFFAAATTRMTFGEFSPGLWEKLADLCLECGGCSFVCPLCYCFNQVDISSGGGGGERLRVWDSCNYEGYTREAAGFNPRALSHQRLWRRLFHKVSYQYIEKEGSHGCVGCGRCVMTCPGLTDLPYVVKALRRGRPEKLLTGMREITTVWYFRPYGAKEVPREEVRGEKR